MAEASPAGGGTPSFFDFLGDVLGIAASSEAADDLKDSQTAAAKQQTDLLRAIYGDQRALNAPQMAASNAALEQQMRLLGLDFGRGADIGQAFGAGPTAGGSGPGGASGGLGGDGIDWEAYAHLPENADHLQAYQNLRPKDFKWLAKKGYGNTLGEYTRYMAENDQSWLKALASGQRPDPRAMPVAPASTGLNAALGAPAAPTGGPTGPTQSPTDMVRSTPGYEFAFDEGNRALSAAFAGSGALNSGARAKAAIKYGQDYGSNQYDKQLQRLREIIAPGSQATANVGNAGTNYATGVNAATQNAADAQGFASAYKFNTIGNAGKSAAKGLGSIDWSKVF